METETIEPDHVTAKRELRVKLEGLGYKIESTPCPARKDWTRDPYAGHVAFTLTHGNQTYQGQYSAGSGILLQWAIAELKTGRKIKGTGYENLGGIPCSLKDLELMGSLPSYGRSIHAGGLRDVIRKAWRPELVDVVASMLSDVSSFAPDCSFREWLDEGTAEGMNPADALETYEAIRREAAFLRRTAGKNLDTLCELAGRL